MPNNLVASLNRLKELPLPFIAPIVTTNQVVYTIQEGRAFVYQLPELTPKGWWLIEAHSKTSAGVARRAWAVERMEYLRQLPKEIVITIAPFINGYTATKPATYAPLDVFLPGEMLAPTMPFATTIVRRLGGLYLYDTTSLDVSYHHATINGEIPETEPYLSIYAEVRALIDSLTDQERELYTDKGIIVSLPLGKERIVEEYIPGLCLIGEQPDLPTLMTVMASRQIAATM